jgi:hypothetical protein
MSCRPAPSRRSQTAARGARNRPAVTSDPPLLPRPTGERGRQPCRRHAIAPSGRASPTPDTPARRPRPTRRATGAPDAACKQLYRLCHHRASSIVEPIPRPEATQRATQQRQPDAAANAAKGGPAVMTVAGAREQRTRRQPSSRPIRGQQENPLSRPIRGQQENARGPFLERHAHAQRQPRQLLTPSHQLRGWTGGASGRSSGRRFAFAETTAPKKVRRVVRFRIPFLFFPLSLSLATGTGKGGYPERDPSP